MPFVLDTSTEFGRRVESRLHDEPVIWLSTVNADGTPEPSPVWFYWDGDSVLVYSLRGTPRERNIRRSPRVALNFNSDGEGGNIVVLSGTAEIVDDQPPADRSPGYAAKDRDDFGRIGVTAEQFAQRYALAIRVRPTRLRGY